MHLNGTIIIHIGELEVNVKYKNENKSFKIFVMGKPLIIGGD